MKENKPKIIKMYQCEDGSCPISLWLESIHNTFRYRIKARLARVTLGNLGDYKSLGDGLYELKFNFGSGYRIYYGEKGNQIILLLCGGDKSSQVKDIKIAREYLKDFLEGEHHDQKH